MRTQLVATARRLGLGDGDGRVPDGVASAAQPLSSEEAVELRRALAAAFFLQAAVRRPSGDYVTLVSRQTVSIHPSSALFSRRAPCVLYNELVFTTRLYMRDLTTIEAAWLAEVAPHFFKSGAAGGSGDRRRALCGTAANAHPRGRQLQVTHIMNTWSSRAPHPSRSDLDLISISRSEMSHIGQRVRHGLRKNDRP